MLNITHHQRNTNEITFFLNFFLTFIYFWDRERQSMNGGGAEREGDRIGNKLPGSEPSAQSLMWGSNSWTARSWPGWSRTLNRLRHPGAPKYLFILERERVRVSEQGRGRERRRERIPSSLFTVSAESNVGLKPTNGEIMTWAKIKSQSLNWPSHPGAPITLSF